jgi:hypothetical protein
LVLELRGIGLTTSQLALAAVAAFPAGAAVDAARTLAGLCEAYGHRELAQVLEQWAERRISADTQRSRQGRPDP